MCTTSCGHKHARDLPDYKTLLQEYDREAVYTIGKPAAEQSYRSNDTHTPVSYTHLDVYKRQVYRLSEIPLPEKSLVFRFEDVTPCISPERLEIGSWLCSMLIF